MQTNSKTRRALFWECWTDIATHQKKIAINDLLKIEFQWQFSIGAMFGLDGHLNGIIWENVCVCVFVCVCVCV